MDQQEKESEKAVLVFNKTTELLRTILRDTGPVAVADWNIADTQLRIKDSQLQSLARNYVPDQHGGACILGPTGLGKSLTAVAVIRRVWCLPAAELFYSDRVEYLERAARGGLAARVQWVRAFDLPNARLQQRLGDGENDLIARAKAVEFLVLDDLGRESRRGGADDVVEEVLLERYDTGRFTYVSSGLTSEALLNRYGDAVIRRVTEAGRLKGCVLQLWKGGKA